MAQNDQRKTRRLPMPVLALAGAESSGEMVRDTMRLAADDVQSIIFPECGHWLAEQVPDGMVAALSEFLHRTAIEGPTTRPSRASPDRRTAMA
jgi:pimeloyl-ACP methyl ester carboxylesterase